VLAAGSSSRLGRPKQLLPYNGKSLLEFTVDTAMNSRVEPVIVVLGSNAELIARMIDKKRIHIVKNKDWIEGMASSIRCGIEMLTQISPSADAVILMVCDQPFVSASLLNNLVSTQKSTSKLIVTCQYRNVVGPPTLFYKTIFPDLLGLKGDTGAKNIVANYINDVATVQFDEGIIDIDTETDYRALK
jgi:molybdenum cofactor cytidylyltransferase